MVRQVLDNKTLVEKGWINVHYLADSVRACLKQEWPITTLMEAELSGNRVLLEALSNTQWTHLLVINGDMYCDIPFKALFQASENRDGALLVRDIVTGSRYRSLECEVGQFLKRGPLAESGLMFTGVCVLSRKAVQKIQSKNFFDDFEQNRIDIGICHYNGLWLDFGDPLAYYLANISYLERFQRPGCELWSPESQVPLNPVSVDRSILWPRSVIRAGVRLKRCIVCDGVVLEKGDYSDGICTMDGFVPF